MGSMTSELRPRHSRSVIITSVSSKLVVSKDFLAFLHECSVFYNGPKRAQLFFQNKFRFINYSCLGQFLEFGTSDGIETANYDSTKFFSTFGHGMRSCIDNHASIIGIIYARVESEVLAVFSSLGARMELLCIS